MISRVSTSVLLNVLFRVIADGTLQLALNVSVTVTHSVHPILTSAGNAVETPRAIIVKHVKMASGESPNWAAIARLVIATTRFVAKGRGDFRYL